MVRDAHSEPDQAAPFEPSLGLFGPNDIQFHRTDRLVYPSDHGVLFQKLESECGMCYLMRRLVFNHAAPEPAFQFSPGRSVITGNTVTSDDKNLKATLLMVAYN